MYNYSKEKFPLDGNDVILGEPYNTLFWDTKQHVYYVITFVVTVYRTLQLVSVVTAENQAAKSAAILT